jgi:hypothetical protein
MIGRDLRGNWVVQDQYGVRGGLFVGRDAALRYVRAESGNRPQAVVTVSGILELDMIGRRGAALGRQFAASDQQTPPGRVNRCGVCSALQPKRIFTISQVLRGVRVA